jgi:pSer/pThr/pTyr-binding forkhead associated (FHA) protein
MSKTHARLYWEHEKFYIVDVGSANGTIVTTDGHETRLRPLVPFLVEDGMKFELGDVLATFTIPPKPPEAGA